VSRVQLALRVSELEASVAFYSKLFGAEPAKRRPGYANFAIAEPPLKLVLIEGEPGAETVLDHLGVEVGSSEEVTAATSRLTDAGLVTLEENDTSCCYAVQDKVWDANNLSPTGGDCCVPVTDSGVPVAEPATARCC